MVSISFFFAILQIAPLVWCVNHKTLFPVNLFFKPYTTKKQHDGGWSNSLHWYQRKISFLFRLWYSELSHCELLSLEEHNVSVSGVEVTLKIESDVFSETLLSIDRTTQCVNPENHDWVTHCPQDVISHKAYRLLSLFGIDYSGERLTTTWTIGVQFQVGADFLLFLTNLSVYQDVCPCWQLSLHCSVL